MAQRAPPAPSGRFSAAAGAGGEDLNPAPQPSAMHHPNHSVDLDALLHDPFGFGEFRPGQREAIAALLEHGAALAVFPTGGGKSLCYQLPALALEGVTLVVSPLIALMKDQIDFLQRKGVAAARLDSSLTTAEALAVSDDLRAGRLKLLY